MFADHCSKIPVLSRLLLNSLISLGMGCMHRRRSFLPVDICTEEGVSEEDILQAKTNPGIANVAFKVASQAKVCALLESTFPLFQPSISQQAARWHVQGHLTQARAMSLQLPAHARPLMMPAVAAGLYLEALERLDFDVFAPQLQRDGGFSSLWYQLLTKYSLLRNAY